MDKGGERKPKQGGASWGWGGGGVGGGGGGGGKCQLKGHWSYLHEELESFRFEDENDI